MEKEGLSPINSKKAAKINRLIKDIYSSKESAFYKNIWNKRKGGKIDFSSLPTIDLNHLVGNQFDKRLYLKNGLFVKIVYRNNVPFLMAKTKESIGKENYGEISGTRPLVVFENPHESIEKGLWFYGRNILPLIAEDNPDITLMAAGRYGIDSIFGDTESIKKLTLKATGYLDCAKIIGITIIDSYFDENLILFLKKLFPASQINYVFSLPETGSLGLLCKEAPDKQIFHPSENTFIETDKNEHLLATQLILTPTPIIKYKTIIKIKTEESPCSCGKNFGFSLKN